ncbi:ABC transporter permease [Candidatus Salinivivens marinus]|uniref:ABC transporter permease n=1 Tax=Candidatus Salinivivens marinus TaxID=3381703 RepID=UPI003F69CE29
MTSNRTFQVFLGLYISIFFLYLFGPLIIMSVTAFNSTEFPSITPWECFSFRWFNEGKIAYDGQRLAGLAADRDLHVGLITSLFIALGVVTLSVPIGMSAAIVLTQVHSKLRTLFYSMSIMPVLFPGVVIGISTVVLWDRIATIGGEGIISELGRNGIFLTILGQTCFISTYCFLIFVARLQRFDTTQEEAALDLGASQTQVFMKIMIPYLMPAIGSSAVIAFLASFENYNTTVFSILSEQTLTTVIATKVRLGISPAISALAFVIICMTLVAAVLYEFFRRRQEKRKALESAAKMYKEISSDRLKEDIKKAFILPKSIFVILFIFLMAILGWQQIIKNNLYGGDCIAKAEDAKKSNFADQLKLLQNNAESLESEGGDGGTGSTNEYNDIFGDPNLFKNFGGFDN